MSLKFARDEAEDYSAISDATLDYLEKVNTEINSIIDYTPDKFAFGVNDLWRNLPKGGRGDCDDYAVTKKFRLLESERIDADRLRLTICVTETRELHAVLSVFTGRKTKNNSLGIVVLDNRYPSIYAYYAANYFWLQCQGKSDGEWRDLTRSAWNRVKK